MGVSISINLIATNKYVYFLEEAIKSIDKFFIKNSNLVVILHTNRDIDQLNYRSERIKVLKNEIGHEPWPLTTLKRFSYFIKAKEIIIESDYSFYIDVDSLFIGEISEEILPQGGIMATIHPCQFGTGSPDRNPNSKAYLPHSAHNRYFCGGFFGGKSEDFLKMSESLRNNIEDDLSRNVMALWHDESHINHFLYYNPPAYIFEPPFASAENFQIPDLKRSKILFLDKGKFGGHNFFRS
jgi:hypothetical protein